MIRLLHLSDPHFGAADPLVADRFIETARSLAPDFTFVSGDLTMRARRAELRAARAFVGKLPQPQLVIPGNHDIPALNQPFDRFFRPFHRYRGSFGHELEPELRARGIHAVGMNSNQAFGFHANWSEGRLSRETLARAEERLAAQETGLRVLMLHHPLLGPPEHDREVVKPLPELLSLIARQQVDLVLCGHFHRSHLAALPAGAGWHTVVSQAATVCSTRLQGEPQGFHVIEWSGDRLDITRHRFAATRFAEDAHFTFRRDAGTWQAADRPTRDESARNP
ncbi:metallophosphoesterase family protein [Luteolibacter marinus]|uniref:metallophosphoesterase family protein n=1 Tax=Luteolibacter marinus TaxID=2776705 RepID=UPI001866E1A9|nr:metallophosphoesterase [Luteolibacter marinus]